ncbi:hypothetical protein ROJ8625_03328 [Roseivivax jejudonensis]|uniref:Uncharacterized protein n=1 Tax=Roseivivax jejudonensis TaxID=1529041 RepID=A0A1X7A0P3_9RHOB|nr:hypothetical protein [Roseivivax jejudonensis]SLN65262.1 hypothetical protein ROJ8625_03328 [Roseivivax jejudonensis]
MRPHVSNPFRLATLPIAIGAACLPVAAQAYVGPGAGLTAIGTLIALVAAVLLAIVGFVWYPMKRMMRNRAERQDTRTAGAGGEGRRE